LTSHLSGWLYIKTVYLSTDSQPCNEPMSLYYLTSASQAALVSLTQ